MCAVCVCVYFFFSSRRRHTRCALVTGVQTCALPILPEACRRYRDLLPVLLTVDSALLHQRLSSRGREGREQITARLERNKQLSALPSHAGANPVITVDNSGPIDHAVTIDRKSTRLNSSH